MLLLLKMLLRWRCYLIEDVVALKMLLRWRCCYKCFQNGFVDVKKKSLMWIFAHDSLGSMTFLCQSKETWNSKKHAIAMESTKIIYNEELKKDKTHSNSGTYPRYVVRMLNWFLVLSSHGKKTQRCKTQWAMTFFKVDNNELQLTSGLYPIYLIHIVIKDRWTIYTSTTLWWNPQSINRRVFGRPNSQGTTRATRPPWSQQRCGDVRIVLSGGSNFGDTNDAPIESRLKIRC